MENTEQISKEEQLATLEAILFIHGEPITREKIGHLMSLDDGEVHSLVEELQKRLTARERGLVIVQGSNKIQLATKPQFSNLVEQFVKSELSEDLSPASLETLAIISYFGPISRSRIDYQRGVNSSFILRSLLLRGLVDRRLNPAHPNSYLYAPSFETLKYVGIAQVSDLPNYKHFQTLLGKFESQEPSDVPAAGAGEILSPNV